MGETLLSFLVQVRNGDARSKDSIVGVLGGQVGGSLRSKVLQRRSGTNGARKSGD